MSGWGGFWIGVAIVLSFGCVSWQSRIDCGWLGMKLACNYVNAGYMPQAHNPLR